MIGIYQDSFKDFLEENLGSKIKINNNNIICKCPWCDLGKKTSKDHLWASLNIPIFNCFRAGCNAKGHIRKLILKIKGSDISDSFIDKKRIKKSTIIIDNSKQKKEIKLPEIRTDIFPNKTLYTKKRLKFANIDLKYIKGLIFDVNQFIQINNISINPTLFKIKEYLHTNFVGFLSEHASLIIFRNIDPTSTFRFFKLQLDNNKIPFLDYYKIPGPAKDSKTIILGEGVFDIYSIKLFDFLNINNKVRLFAAPFSAKYASLIQSLVFYEQEYRLDIIILSDNGIYPEYYRKIKKENEHIINTCSVYYNKSGKDFNTMKVTPVKVMI